MKCEEFAYKILLEAAMGPAQQMMDPMMAQAGQQMGPQMSNTGVDAMGREVSKSIRQGVTGKGMGKKVVRQRGQLNDAIMQKMMMRQSSVGPVENMTAAAQAGNALNQQYQQGMLQAAKTQQMLQQMMMPNPMMMNPMMGQPGMMGQQPGMPRQQPMMGPPPAPTGKPTRPRVPNKYTGEEL